MMKSKKAFLISAILLIILTFSIIALEDGDTEKISANLLVAKRDILLTAMTKFIAKMDAAISVAKEKSLDVSKLQSVKQEFVDQKALLMNASTADSVLSIKSEAISLSKEFRDTAKEIGLKAYEEEVNETQKSELEKVRNQTDFYTEDAANARMIGLLKFYDQHIEWVERVINLSKSKNVSTILIEQKLAEFKALKPELVDALNSKNKDTIQAVMKKLKDKWKEIHLAINDTYKEHSIIAMLKRAKTIANRLDVNIQKLKSAGISTSVLEQQNGEFKDKIDEIQKALDEGNSTKAEELVAEIENQFKDLVKTYSQVRTGEVKVKINQTKSKGEK